MDGGAATNPEIKTITSEVVPKVSPQAKAKKPKGWMITAIILGVIIIGLAGFLIFHFVTTSHDEKACEEKACEIVEVKDEETGETVKIVKVPVGNSDDDVAVRALVDRMYYDVAGKITAGNSTGPFVRTYDDVFIIYRPEGLKAGTGLSLTYGFELMSGANGGPNWSILEAIHSAITNELLQSGFRKYEYDTLAGKEYINEKDGIICVVNEPSLPYTFGCGSINWYDVKDVDFFNELVEAFEKKTGENPYLISVTKDNIKNSNYEGYQVLQVSFGNAMGLFYRTSPDGEWIFFRGGQDAPACSEFDTDDLKKAFVGTSCWNDATGEGETVKL